MKIYKLIFFLAYLMLTQKTSSTCVEGCLACQSDSDDNPICQICDSKNFYRLLLNGSCIKWNVENCLIPSTNLEKLACNLCMPGYFLDNQSNRCSLVPQRFLVPNCKHYHWEYSCLECIENFYLTKKK